MTQRVSILSGYVRECDKHEMQAAIMYGLRVLVRTGVYGYRYGDYVYIPKREDDAQ